MLGIQHLDMPNLRGRRERERERDEVVRKNESDVEFDFKMTEGVRTSRSTDEAKDATNKKTSGRTWTKYRLARCMKGS